MGQLKLVNFAAIYRIPGIFTGCNFSFDKYVVSSTAIFIFYAPFWGFSEKLNFKS